eukprot:1153963-Pelagomonas_calceolata.AAC.6
MYTSEAQYYLYLLAQGINHLLHVSKAVAAHTAHVQHVLGLTGTSGAAGIPCRTYGTRWKPFCRHKSWFPVSAETYIEAVFNPTQKAACSDQDTHKEQSVPTCCTTHVLWAAETAEGPQPGQSWCSLQGGERLSRIRCLPAQRGQAGKPGMQALALRSKTRQPALLTMTILDCRLAVTQGTLQHSLNFNLQQAAQTSCPGTGRQL